MESVVARATSNVKLWTKGYPEIGATYRTVGATCPASCVFNPINKGISIEEAIERFGAGVEYAQIGQCYADKGHTGFWSKKAAMLTATDWGKISGRGLVRVNVSGDILGPSGSLDEEFLQGLYDSAKASMPRPGDDGTVFWLYTHAWEILAKSTWYPRFLVLGNVKILASVNTDEEYKAAKALGLRTARATNNPDKLNKREVVCPEQTGKASSCVACGLCPGRKGTPKGNAFDWIDLQVAPDIVFVLH